MPAAQLNKNYLRALKRALQGQCDASSAHLTEAIARGLGFRSHAALLTELKHSGDGRYVRFDEPACRARLAELSGSALPETLTLPPLDHDARYVESLFDDPSLEIVELRPMRAQFRLAGIATVVKIDLEHIGNGYFRFHRSHAIHSPTQLGPYRPSRDFDDDPAYGMYRAIESLASYYKAAVRAGHRPAPSWLVQ